MNFIVHLTILIIYLSLLTIGSCIRWNMHPNSQKCLRGEIRENILVKGEYEITVVEHQRIDYIVSIF